MKLEINTDRIYCLMKQEGIKSTKQLAINCGIPPKTIYQMFYRGKFSKETLYMIAYELGCSMDYLVRPNWEK